METQPKLSVIVPVFNTKTKYLKLCIDSLLNQTLKDIEVICVDNGSESYIGEILDEYVAKDARIKKIRINVNNGLSPARNLGIKYAAAPYITFVDSDDWLEQECYEQTLKYFEEDDSIDLVVFKAIVEQEQNNSVFTPIKNNWHDFPMQGIFNSYDKPVLYRAPRTVWNKLFKTEVIKQNNLLFIENLRLEDVHFYLSYCLNCKRCYFVDKKYYHYRLHKDNTTIQWFQVNRIETIKDNIKILESILSNPTHNKEFLKEVVNAQLSLMPSLNLNFKIKEIRKVKKMLFNFAQSVQPEYRGEILNWILKNKFYQIKNKNFPKFLVGNDYIGFVYYGEPIGQLKIKIFGIKISFHYSKIFSLKDAQDKKHKVLSLFNLRFKFDVKSSAKTRFINALRKIFYIKNSASHKIINLFGFKIKTKIISDPSKKLQDLSNQIKGLKKYISNEVFLASAVRDLHRNSFKQFKSINYDKDVVILASGPTSLFYMQMENAVHIGVNKAFKCSNVRLDYLFAQDYSAVETYIDEMLAYPCIKFLGDYVFSGKSRIDNCIIPQNYRNTENTFSYYSDYTRNLCYPDLEHFPLMDFGSVVFPAIHFAFYTNPKRIYLVGCDCSNAGYFDNTRQQHTSEHLVAKWQLFKKFKDTYYPDIEIISINPVGLKGMFKDIYTEEYLNQVNKEINDENSSYSSF